MKTTQYTLRFWQGSLARIGRLFLGLTVFLPTGLMAQVTLDSIAWVIVQDESLMPTKEEGGLTNNAAANAILSAHGIVRFEQAMPWARSPLLRRVCELQGLSDVSPAYAALRAAYSDAVYDLTKLVTADSTIALYDPIDYWYWEATQNPGQGQWNLLKTQCNWAWDITKGDPSIVLMVSDQKIDGTHPDLAPKLVVPYDPRTPSYTHDCVNASVHGTFVASCAASETTEIGGVSNGYLAAASFKCQLIGYRGNVVGQSGFIQNCVHASTVMGARTITHCGGGGGLGCSLSGVSATVVAEAINEIHDNGTCIVFAAGNGTIGHHCGNEITGWLPFWPLHPSFDERIIIVSSTDKEDNHLWNNGTGVDYHSHFPEVDLCAPGYAVMGARETNCGGGDYATSTGTSFASPNAASIAALVISINPCYGPEDVQHILKATTDPITDAANYPGMVGTGRINAYEACLMALGYGYYAPITGNETWSDNRFIADDLIIEAGATLTVTGTLRFADGVKIVVERGAKLIVDGGTLTKAQGCHDDFWSGIEIWGDNAHNQFPTNLPTHQGMVVLRNGATIEHAREAITMQQPGVYWTFGGVVQATDATFLNCRRSVEFLSYQNTTPGGAVIPNRSYFHRVDFIVDENYRGGDDFYAHVSMWGVHGVSFTACNFENRQNANTLAITESAKLGYGIISEDASYRVVGQCATNPPWVGDVCPSYIPTTFKGLDHGINARNFSTTRNFIVDHCLFEDNVCGVYANGVVGFQVRNSRFKVGGNEVPVMNNPDEFYWNYRHRAVFSTESWAFAIDDNEVEQSGTHDLTEGIVVGYSRDHNDVVFRNQATGLERAYIGEGISADLAAGYTATRGLWFLCNGNNNNSRNFWARKVTTAPLPEQNSHTVRLNQGLPYRPADNAFDQWAMGSGKWDFLVSTSHSPVIYWHRNTGNYVPVSYTISTTGLFPTSATYIPANNCANKVQLTIPWDPDYTSGMAPGPVVGYLLSEKLAYGNTRYLYEQLIDDGNTDEVVEEITAAWPQDAWDLRNYLLSKSPFLSTDALKSMVLRNILPDAMVTEILVANPAATRSDGFLTWLQEESGYPLPEYMLGMVVASWDVRGYRDALEAEMTLHHAELTQAANMLLHHYQILPLADDDSTSVPMDNVLWVWQQVRTPSARYAEALTWLQLGNYAQATAVIESIPTERKLRAPESLERQRMLDLIAFLGDLHGNGRSEMQLDSGEVATLESLMGDAYDRPATLISNLLCFGYGHCRPPLTGGEEDEEPKALPYTPLPHGKAEVQATLLVHPNPASTWVAIDYDLLIKPTDAAIVIRDLAGREVRRITLREQRRQVVWDSRQAAPGSYTVVLLNSGRRLGTEKLIIRQ
jgi:hypothetical protein